MDEKKTILLLAGVLVLLVGFLFLFEDSTITGRGTADLNSGTINLFFDETAEIISVWGEAPADVSGSPGARGAKLKVFNMSNGAYVELDFNKSVKNISQNNNTYSFAVNVSSWPREAYNLRVLFYDNATIMNITHYLAGFDVSMIFNDLAHDQIETEIVALELKATNLENNVSTLLDMVNTTTANISQLFSVTQTIAGEINDLWTEVDSLNASVNVLSFRIDILNATVINLESWLSNLDDQVQDMDHGSVNVYYIPHKDELKIWGQAPVDARRVRICFTESAIIGSKLNRDDKCGLSISKSFSPGSGFYMASLDDVSSTLDDVSYNVVVFFYESNTDYNNYDPIQYATVSEIFNDLLIMDIAIMLDELGEDVYGNVENDFIDDARDAWCVWRAEIGDTSNPYNAFCNHPNKETNWESMTENLGYDDLIFVTARNLYYDSATQWNNISEIWNELEEIWVEIGEIWEVIGDMSHGSLNMYYIGEQGFLIENRLYVWGQAPLEAECAKVELVDTGGNVVETLEDDELYDNPWYVSGNNELTYWVRFRDTDELDPIKYNVRVKFYADDSCDDDYMGRSYDVGDFFDNLVLENLMYGFNDIVFTSRVETYYEPEITVPITYTFRTDQPTWGDVKIWLRDDSNGFEQPLRRQDIDADEIYRFTDEVEFNETGTYNFTLEAERRVLFWNVVFESQTFTTDVVALEDFVPNSTIELVKPTKWGNDRSDPQNPPDDDHTSWHQSGLIRVVALIGANTPLTDTACDVYYYSNENPKVGRLLLSGLKIKKNETRCAEHILSTMMDQGREGVYEVEVEQEFIASYDQMDYMAIGIDDTPPVVTSIVPDSGSYSGKLWIYADVSDPESETALDGTYSGVKKVWMTLVNKETGENYTKQSNYNETSEKWQAKFKTGPNNLNLSDGSYNISVRVVDIAGNSIVETVDPDVDNTAPEVSKIQMPEDMCVGGESIISLYVIDALAGVCSINVELKVNGTWIPLVLNAGSKGRYEFKFNPEINGTYEVRLKVEAEDCAVGPNDITNRTRHNITVAAECPKPSTGGGGGGGKTLGTRCEDTPEHWNCGDWSACVGGTQTMSCTKKSLATGKTCYNGDEPKTSRKCEAQPEEQGPSEFGGEANQTPEAIAASEQKAEEQVTQELEERPSLVAQLKGNTTMLAILVALLAIVIILLTEKAFARKKKPVKRKSAKKKVAKRKPKKKAAKKKKPVKKKAAKKKKPVKKKAAVAPTVVAAAYRKKARKRAHKKKKPKKKKPAKKKVKKKAPKKKAAKKRAPKRKAPKRKAKRKTPKKKARRKARRK